MSSAHQRACAWKQQERQSSIDALPSTYALPLSPHEHKLHALSLAELVAQCRSGHLAPATVMLAYAKNALVAHRRTNCLADLMFDEALAIPAVANWALGVGVDDDSSSSSSSSTKKKGSLLGVPVSIKDTVNIKGHDTTIGYSRNVDRPKPRSAAIVRLLQDAGALIHVKTTVPTALIAIETVSDLFGGPTTNPHDPLFSCGGSTGGGAALLACGGSKIEIGTDIGGSVRLPAHFCGVWGLKGSHGRFPSWGTESPLVGLEAVPIVAAPMAGSLDDLTEFWRRVVGCEPWQYDHTCVPLPWRDVNLREEGRKLKWGVIWEDGTIPPTPACRRALSTVVSALKKQGHEVVDFQPPNVFEGLKIGYQLLFSDGGHQIRAPLSPGERLSAASSSILSLLSLPSLIKRLLSYLTRSSDPISSQLYDVMETKTVLQQRELVARRDAYRQEWHERWTGEAKLDFVLTVPLAIPAIRHGDSERTTLLCAGYTLLFNVLDYVAGVLPVTHVDRDLDKFVDHDHPKSNLKPKTSFHSSSSSTTTTTTTTTTKQQPPLSSIAKAAYSTYDPSTMHGLPLGVQVVGRRFEEEKVLEGMWIVEDALRRQQQQREQSEPPERRRREGEREGGMQKQGQGQGMQVKKGGMKMVNKGQGLGQGQKNLKGHVQEGVVFF